jgi:signal transduction histidine kinase
MVSSARWAGAATYDESRTKVLIDSLATLLSGIRNLKTAVGRAEYVECDLAVYCRESCADFEDAAKIFHFAGPAPFMVEIDPGLFRLALGNVVRNAVEAVSVVPEGSERSVTLNWGWAGHEFWVAVLDTGAGFEREPASMAKLGETTKAEHIGFGLATAKQAMQAMEGDIYPSNAQEGGARVELRWFGSHEDLVR